MKSIMKRNRITGVVILTVAFLFNIQGASAQFGGLLDKASKAVASKGSKMLGLDKLLKEPEAISTSFEDVNRKGEQMPDFQNTAVYKPLENLQKNGNDGYLLEAGHFEMTNKSYCLKAGTYAPSKGDGYMYAPTLGKKREVVIAILKSAEKHPEVAQSDIQMLLWTIIAKTKFIDYSGPVKETALKLLTAEQFCIWKVVRSAFCHSMLSKRQKTKCLLQYRQSLKRKIIFGSSFPQETIRTLILNNMQS